MNTGLVLRIARQKLGAVIFLRYCVDWPDRNGSHHAPAGRDPKPKHCVIDRISNCGEQ